MLYICCFLAALLSPFHAPDLVKVYTLPKSGTFLIETILILEGFKGKRYLGHFTDDKGCPVPITGKRVVNIRDLRDYFVSLKSFSNKVVKIGLGRRENWPGFKPIDQYEDWLSMTDDEQLLALITMDSRIPCYELAIFNNIVLADEQLNEAQSNPEVLVCKYEAWIGEKGGGNYDDFCRTLKGFFNHFGY